VVRTTVLDLIPLLPKEDYQRLEEWENECGSVLQMLDDVDQIIPYYKMYVQKECKLRNSLIKELDI
jgi:hypothetical protein